LDIYRRGEVARSRAKFVELAEKRVNRAMNELRLIGNLSNKTNYEYTDADVSKMFRALENVLKDTRSKFKDGHRNGAGEFKL
jgi:hypothetical protein